MYPGSSPLTRGKLRGRELKFVPERLIPAHAGKTSGARSGLIKAKAHPRSRGENPTRSRRSDRQRGSSPLTRGKPPQGTAGRTRHAAHPRSRGENTCCPHGRALRTGSSPLTRGKPHVSKMRHHCLGLIPAHAGKTNHVGVHCGSPSAHPRSRGENNRLMAQATRPQGSSPLTRGKLH